MKLLEKLIWPLLKVAYRIKLRAVIVAAIDDPDSGVDDAVIAALDTLFEYNGKG